MDLVICNGTLVDGTGAPARRADVGVDGGRIREVAPGGALAAVPARERIDASGCIVTPGFVDPHTHYDGQVTWDPELAPSSWHGVTSVVMGNCGVGFAPAQPARRRWLIELMEGVEDIPGTALHEGMRWSWESFPEYLDALARQPRAVEVAAQVPHGALRAYVMGERVQEPASAREIERMAALVGEAIAAGAVAFSTNRLPLHTSIHGEPVPGTHAGADELLAIARAVRAAGGHLVQAVPAGAMGEHPSAQSHEIELYRRISLEADVTVTFSFVQVHRYPEQWRALLEQVERANAAGARLVPQVQGRPAGLFLGWDAFNPFLACPSYRALARLPLAERVRELREPRVRARILAEVDGSRGGMAIMQTSFDTTFAMRDAPVFEPTYAESVKARAEREGASCEALLYDAMCDLAEQSSPEGARFFHVFFSGYKGCSLDALSELISHPQTVVGLADGGAHVTMICDASLPTFMLAHWVRDRSRGARIPLERAVAMLSCEPADLYRLRDRGRVHPGQRADLNVIDLARLELPLPEVAHDLPTGARRIVQRAHGYVATLCGGRVTFREGRPTGDHPAGVIRAAHR
jgi:N-acyl-D-aspartate/D-glutamate deacylase